MTYKRIAVTLMAFLFAAGAAIAEPLAVRTFLFKYKDADKAAAVIKPLMSSEGSLSIQPSTNALIVTDHSDRMKAIAGAIQQFDAPAQPFHLHVRLIAASHVEGAAPKVSDDMKDVAAKLAMLRFNAFESLGDSQVDGKEGDPGIIEMASGYRADFRFGEFDQTTDSIKVADFRLSKLQGAQKDQLTQLLKTTLNLKLGQTLILGASRDPQSQRALMIVVVARR
jgi:hypothetical protein